MHWIWISISFRSSLFQHIKSRNLYCKTILLNICCFFNKRMKIRLVYLPCSSIQRNMTEVTVICVIHLQAVKLESNQQWPLWSFARLKNCKSMWVLVAFKAAKCEGKLVCPEIKTCFFTLEHFYSFVVQTKNNHKQLTDGFIPHF